MAAAAAAGAAECLDLSCWVILFLHYSGEDCSCCWATWIILTLSRSKRVIEGNVKATQEMGKQKTGCKAKVLPFQFLKLSYLKGES